MTTSTTETTIEVTEATAVSPSVKYKSSDLLPIATKHIKITDGVAEIDNKAIVDAALAHLDNTHVNIKKAYDDTALINNAVAEAFSDLSIDYMSANPEIDQVTGKTNICEEELHLVSRRSMEVRNPSTRESMSIKGALTTRRVIKNRGGELTSIKQLAKQRGINKL